MEKLELDMFDIPTLVSESTEINKPETTAPETENIESKAKAGALPTNKLIERISNVKKQQDKPVQLPIWAEGRRGMPNSFLRSALFTCRCHSDERQFLDELQLPSTSDFKITYTGMELSQDDEDVYMEIIHRSRYTPLGDSVMFSAYEILGSLRWGKSAKDYKRLQDTIHRLTGGTIKILHKQVKGYGGSLIRKYAFDELDDSGKTRYKVWLEPELINQFQENNYTQLRYEQRKKLGKSGLSKWLHSYYSTHADPNGMKTITIKTMSGSDAKSLAGFRHNCKKSHEKLIDVGFLNSYSYDPKTDIFKAERK